MFKMMWGTIYATQGRAYPLYWISGTVVMTGDLLLVLLALLVGQGYLISHPVMLYKYVTYALFAITAVCGYAMEIYDFARPDDPLYAYTYDTIPGIIYNTMRCVCALFFIFCSLQSRRRETYPERKALYDTLLIIYATFLIGPMVCWGLSFLMPKWYREVNNYLFSRMLDFVAICIIVYLTNPESIEDNFRVANITGGSAKQA